MDPSSQRSPGRPRSFDDVAVIDRAVDTLWRHGASRATTRTLESELGLSQSSIYNAFGSKAELLGRVLDRYESMLDDDLVGPLGRPDAARHDIVDFVDRLVEWVSQDDRPGCLLLNATLEADADVRVRDRGARYRSRLRDLFRHALATDDGASVADERAALTLAAVLGISAAASSGADRSELDGMAAGVKRQLADW